MSSHSLFQCFQHNAEAIMEHASGTDSAERFEAATGAVRTVLGMVGTEDTVCPSLYQLKRSKTDDVSVTAVWKQNMGELALDVQESGLWVAQLDSSFLSKVEGIGVSSNDSREDTTSTAGTESADGRADRKSTGHRVELKGLGDLQLTLRLFSVMEKNRP